MKNRITVNIGLKIISLLIAFMLWLVVNNMNDPMINRSFINIPVKLLNTELITDSGQVYEVLDDTAVISRVTVWAPRSVVSNLSSSNIVATADVNELSSLDTISIKLSTNINSSDIERIEGSIDTVKLNIEYSKTKTLALKATVSGTVEEGYLIGDITPDQNLVRITGPESIVNEISKAVIDVPVTGFTSDISDNAEIKLYDGEDNLIQDSRITQNIKSVGVKVAIYKTLEVPVHFDISGTPAAGYRAIDEIQASRSSVTLAGEDSVLRNVNSIEVPGEVLDISGQTEDYTTQIDIRNYLPDNTFLADSSENKIEVTVSILPEVTRRLEINSNNVEITNIPSGYEAEIPGLSESITVQVYGLSEDISGIRSADIKGSIDIAAWMEEENMEEPESGSYQVQIDFNLPDGIYVEEPMTVTMHLSKLED